MRQVIYGQVPSKSNFYRIVKVGGHATLTKTAALRKYESAFFLQCGLRGQDIQEWFELEVDVYYASNRPDLDNALKVILDCLQQCKAIRNDRYCVRIVARKFVDKERPRIEFEVKTVVDD